MAGLRFAPSTELVLPRRKRGVPARRSDRFLRPESPSRASNKAPRPTPCTLLWLRLRIKTAAIQRVIPLAQERTCEVGAQESARKAESPAPGAKVHAVQEAEMVLVHPFEDSSGSVVGHGKTLALCSWADFLHASASVGRRS